MEIKRRGRPRKNEVKTTSEPKRRGRPKKETNIVESSHSGIPMSQESYKEWQKAFKDIEDSIAAL